MTALVLRLTRQYSAYVQGLEEFLSEEQQRLRAMLSSPQASEQYMFENLLCLTQAANEYRLKLTGSLAQLKSQSDLLEMKVAVGMVSAMNAKLKDIELEARCEHLFYGFITDMHEVMKDTMGHEKAEEFVKDYCGAIATAVTQGQYF